MTGAPLDAEPLFTLVATRTGTRLSRQQRERLVAHFNQVFPGQAPAAVAERLARHEGVRELATLLSIVSVHKTDLFRDEQQLRALEEHVLRPRVVPGQPLAVWSAGCSTGEEVATLLVLLAECGAPPDSTVLGTDLSDAALAKASELAFGAEAMKRVPGELAERYFVRDGQGARLIPGLKARASFQRHNLVDFPYPFSAAGTAFDVIVCRNVLIYFTPEAAKATVEGFVERLRPGGVLVLSTAEPLLEPVAGLATLRLPGAFFYQRVDGSQVAPRPSQPTPLPVPAPRPSRPTPAPRPSAPVPLGAPSAPSITGEHPVVLSPEDEGAKLFQLVLEWAAAGEDHPETESGLRKALYLAPRLAGARYLLGLLLERKGLHPDAALEYRRALQLIEGGTAAPSAFFLNNERLGAACRVALARLPQWK
ncbi:MAG: CheR family methyltransferase [Myxococcaceae bacterium]